MHFPEFYCRKTERQMPRIPYLKTIFEQHHLYTSIACVIFVNYGINNRFRNRSPWNFVMKRCVVAFIADTYRSLDFGKHEIDCLVNKLKHISFINLIRRDRFYYVLAVKVGTFYFGSYKKFLGLFSKK